MKHILSCALAALVAASRVGSDAPETASESFCRGTGGAGQAPARAVDRQPPDATGPRVSLTLEDAVKRALENNLDIAVQRIDQQIYDVDIASIRSVYSPTLSSLVSNSELEERVDEHDFRRPDRRDDQQLHVRSSTAAWRRTCRGAAAASQPAARQPPLGDVER